MNYYLAIDLGTTGCRSMLFDGALQLLASDYREYGLIAPQPDWYEQDARLWWDLACETLQQATRNAGVDASSITAISISSQGISIVPVDKTNTPLCNALSWMDVRAKEQTRQIARDLGEEETYTRTGKRVLACYSLPKILWLQQNQPQIWEKTHKLLMPLDFLTAKFTGKALTDASMASGTLLYDIHRGCWHLPTLETYHIPQRMLPEIVPCGSVAGKVLPEVAKALGLSPECVVSVGAQDQRCAALGAGLGEDAITVSLGTAAAVCKLWRKCDNETHRAVGWSPYVYPGTYVTEGVANTAGAALRWLRDVLYPGCNYDMINLEAAQARRNNSRVLFHPYLGGSPYPRYDVEATGCFYDLSLASQRGDLAHAVMEGVAFQVAEILELMDAGQVKSLVLFGGGAKSELWQQIFADATGKQIIVPQLPEAAGVGAAILAGIGAGTLHWDKLPPIPTKAAVCPGEAYAQTQHRYQRYRKLEDDLAKGASGL